MYYRTLADYHSIFLEIVRYSCYGVCVSDHTDDHTGRSDYRADTTCGNESGDKSGCAGYKTYPVCQGMDDLFCFLDIQYLIIAKISFVIHRVTEILMVFAGLIPSNYEKLQEKLHISGGECTEDGKFSLDACRCIGACGLAPVMTINDDVYGRLTGDELDEILAKY